ncbi:MAG TPA: hypothetical protein GX717_08475 [Clostridiaceae bacterium]|nr:hypothetical protein [Clostridiaceae bacterium]
MWYKESVFYQMYPLGLCGAPRENDGRVVSRILQLKDWLPHLQRLHVNAVIFNPLFDSDRHGYDTRNFGKLDPRLGTNEDLKTVCDAYREAGMTLLFDGVFNHVGRGFWAFQDVLEKREASAYKDWFHIDFGGNTPFNDGFYYEPWEGHYELIKLNLHHPAVVSHLLEQVSYWIEEYGIKGLRLDVAYMVDRDFLRRLHGHCLSLDPDFFLLGEMIHGDYRQIVNSEMCQSATNYECAKGLVSALNSQNLFEIAHSLQRQFGQEPWALYRDLTLLSFVDNHDLSRAATAIADQRCLPLAYTIIFTMPGVPCVYYGSEWAITGSVQHDDADVRQAVETPIWTDLTDLIARLAEIRRRYPVLAYGTFRNVLIQNKQLIFERRDDSSRIWIAVNMEDRPVTMHFDAGCGTARELITDTIHDFGGGSGLEPFACKVWLMETS